MQRHICRSTYMGSSIKYVTLFWTNFDPLPLSHFVTHIGTPLKYVTHLGPPIFSSTCICLYRGFVLVRGGFLPGDFVRGFLSGRFCTGWFLSVPTSVRMHPLQQKAK